MNKQQAFEILNTLEQIQDFLMTKTEDVSEELGVLRTHVNNSVDAALKLLMCELKNHEEAKANSDNTEGTSGEEKELAGS